MKKTLAFILLALFCICGYAQTIDPVLLQEMGQRTDDEKIKVIVIMKSQYDRQQLGRSAAHYTTRAERREFVVNELKQFAEASQYDLRSTLSEMERQDMTTAPKIIYMANALYFSATKQAINDLAMRRDIGLIGLDEKKHVLFDEEMKPANMTREITSNVTQVNADQVWNLGYTGQGVVVAVIDTGVNYNHLDLADHLWDGGSEYPYHGYNFAYDINDPMDDHGHGTHCAGTVCGDGTAGYQTGMAPDATLMCVKVLDDWGWGYASVTCNAMQWAVEQGCDLFSMSLGWDDATLIERTLFRNTCTAILDAGVIGAIAAGNNGDVMGWFPIPNNVGAPGSCPPPYMDPVQENNSGGLSCALCVGAVDVNDEAAYFTSQGPVTWSDTEFGDYYYMEGSSTEFGLIRPDVCAPGVDIVSADSWNSAGYTTMSGTSMATPCVAGCISLLLSTNIDATPAEICQVLEETAVPLEEGKSNISGFGRVDVLAAINALNARPLTLESFDINDEQGNNDGKLNAGEAVTLNISLMNNSDVSLDGATMVLSTESEYVTITNGTAMLPHFEAGQPQTIENIFGFTLSNDTHGNRPIRFTAEAFVNGESIARFRINIMVYGYVLRFDEVTVLSDNNGNSILEAGETANLHVVISNIGNEPATSIIGTLSTAFPHLIINDVSGIFGNIEVDGQVSADFNVTLLSNAPDTYIIDFTLDFVDDNGHFSNMNFKLLNGFILFADDNVKFICVSQWDTDGNGELSYDEAASVTDLYGFQYKSFITSFDELQYFIGLTSIGYCAFEYCTNLRSVVLPNSITSIEDNAFNGCYSLTGSLTLPSTITSIGNNAFCGCFSLTGSLTLPNIITSIGNSAFSSCSGFTGNLTIPNSVTSIGNYAFSNCSGFTGSLTIPNSVTSIGESAFDGCSGFTGSLTIPNSVTSIGSKAFYVCSGLTGNLTIPNSVTSIGNSAFSFCNGLTILTIGNAVTSIGGYAFSPCNNLIYITSLSETPPTLGNQAFGSSNSNAVVNVPCGFESAYVSLSWGGFNNFYGLCGGIVTVIADPEEGGLVSGGGTVEANQTCTVTATTSEGYAFATWTLNGLVVSNNAEYTFPVAGDMTLVAHFVPEGNIDFVDPNIKSICVSHWDTNGDGELSYVEAAAVTDLGGVFSHNSDITSFDELQYFVGLTSIGSSEFFACSGLTSIVIPNSVTSIGSYAFSGCNMTSIVIPNSVTSIDVYAFSYCSGLTSMIVLADNPPTLGYDAFCYVNNGIPVYVPCGSVETYTTANWGGFNNFVGFCAGEITITVHPAEGGTVTGGGYYEDDSICTLTATANTGYSFINWTKDGIGVSHSETYSFYVAGDASYVANFAQGTTITFADANVKSLCVANWDTDGDGELSYAEAAAVTSLDTVFRYNSDIISFDELQYFVGLTSIVYEAFEACYSLTSIEIPNSVTSIGYAAFWGCYDLASIEIPNSVTSIDGNAFRYCSSLDSIEIPNSVTSIGIVAFADCTSLTSIVIPNSVTLIGRSAFSYCSGLASMTVLAQTPPTLGNNYVFYNVDKSIPVYVPCGSIEAYQNATGWNEFTNIIGMCSGEIMVTVNPSESGTVTGAGYYNGGDTCVLTATPNSGFSFENWTENGEVVSTESTYTFIVTGDRNLVANFGEITNHWTPNENDYEDNMTFTCVVQLDGVEQRSTLLELGAFCGEECRGSQMATYFAPTDRYIYQMMVFGESNEMISFRLYDHQLQQELLLSPPADVTFNTNGYGSLTNPYVLNFTSTITHTQALNSGWNWWSTYIELNNNDGLSQLENSIGSAGILIKSRNSGYVEAYEYNGETNWYGTLSSISNEQMYKIRTNAECNAIVEGWLANPADHPITINNGWNWIGFPCNQNVGVDEAMSGFTPENNDIIKSRNGYSTYYSDGNYNMWYGTLNTLESGKGYMYRSNSATQKTLVFATGRGDGHEDNITPENNAFRPADGDFADNMTLTAVVEMDGEELRSEDYELAAFVGDECRGSVRLMYVEPIDRYIAFLTIFGEQDEELYFQLTDGIAGSLASDQMAFAADGIVGTLDNPFVMHFGTLDVDESASANVKIYPNPSEGIFNIEGQNIRKVEVFNAFGQSVYSEETRNGFMKLDLTNRAAGIYLIRIVTNEGILNHQIIKK